MSTLPDNKTGILLVNLGTPEGTDFRSMRAYLKEFLSDRRVIEWPKLFWYPILYGIILNVRPRKSGALYQRIWNHERNESPLRTFMRAQGEKLQQRLGNTIEVRWAMRYGAPSIEDVVNQMIDGGCTRILLFPLYPQYSATTTATVCDAFFDSLKKRRFIPTIRTVPAYPDDPVYIDALARSIETHLKTLSFTPDVLLASYHGIPQSYVNRGDPYYQECQRTTRALQKRLGLNEQKLLMVFQSRFGPEEWLQPYTEETIVHLARKGVSSLAVFTPGFVADCLETLDEIGHEAAQTFFKNGGKNFTYIPCLNDSDDGMNVLEHLIRRELKGWTTD